MNASVTIAAPAAPISASDSQPSVLSREAAAQKSYTQDAARLKSGTISADPH